MRSISTLIVRPTKLGATNGRLEAGSISMPCFIGKGGSTHLKVEGDGKTPCGKFPIRHFYFRHDRIKRSPCLITDSNISSELRWCDDVRSRLYNRPFVSGERCRSEAMWRTDGLYDVVGVLDYNLRSRCIGRGSAIFFHLYDARTSGTEGCISISAANMRRLLPRLSKKVSIQIL